ncbi:SWIM zinc finger family protein [Actinomadura sp. WMMB 499]|uniref:SWIM zinc finger family protein n=1 Tax=Actinomadura sp. WMMB 499 TaxID=1219491 RepID=UPI001243D760|nr:SWIM zinc finger family protein [Actinomadura sp. WMMB 499]QFG20570.1 SWIM zinc finger family protein [Actinomadura sp. WMMB 499]
MRDLGTGERRGRRVDDGLAELDRWLRDQVAHGLARAERAPYRLWDDAARRLVDAQAGALAARVRALAGVPREPGWPGRLLAEYALLRLLVRAHRRRDALPAGLRGTVRARVGFPVARDGVLRDGERVRDRWWVIGTRDSAQDVLTARRVWLRGERTGRPALLLTFTGPGDAPGPAPPAGTRLDAELAFYPGALPLRALVAERRAADGPGPGAPPGGGVREFLDEHAAAVARDPWLDRYPATLTGVRLARDAAGALFAVDAAGGALPLRGPAPWTLLAVAGGEPVVLAGEWTPRGLRPLAVWHESEGAVPL